MSLGGRSLVSPGYRRINDGAVSRRALGDLAYQDDAADAVLLELQIKIGVGKAAGSPMLVDNDIAGLGLEVVVERSSPTVFGEDLPASRGELIRRGIGKGDVIARLPARMRHKEDLQSASPRGRDHLAQMIQ